MKQIFFTLTIAIILMSHLPAMSSEAPEETFSVKEAVAEAIKRNPAISYSKESRDAAIAAVKMARGDMIADITASASMTSLGDAPFMYNGGKKVPTAHDTQYKWDITVVQPLFTGYALTSAHKIARAGVTEAELDREKRILDLARDVKSSCYNLLLARKMLMVAEEEVASLEAHLGDARQYYENELIPKNDLLKSEVALAQAIQTRESAAADVKNTEAVLNTLMDAPVTRQIMVLDIQGIPGAITDFGNLSSQALKNRPEIKTLNSMAEKLKLSETIAKSSNYPSISLVGNYERTGDDFLASNNDYSNDHNTSLTLQAQWLLFDGGKSRASASKSRYERRALLQQLRSLENSISLEVRNALLDLEVARENISTAKKALGQAEENWRITRAQYAEQVATSSDVLDARAFLTRSDSNYYRAIYGYMIYMAQLDRATGKQ